MSGTSLDGIDAVLALFGSRRVELHAVLFAPYTDSIRTALLPIVTGKSADIETVAKLDVEIGSLYAETANALIKTAGIARKQVKAIGMHGQTIRHRPNSQPRFTLQIGDPNILVEETGITTVADLRRRDLAAGGQGAPLVPAFHRWLFQNYETDRAVLNIGGIANLTLLPADPLQPILGFDSGPGNGLMDDWIKKHLGERFDHAGAWALSGEAAPSLLNTLLAYDYFDISPPKSTGREEFNLDWLTHLTGSALTEISSEDIQATLCSLSALTIAQALSRFGPKTSELFVCGGGVHNKALMNMLHENVSSHITVSTTDILGLHPNWVEATAFAWLARQTLSQQTGNLASVTGARGKRILGGVYFN